MSVGKEDTTPSLPRHMQSTTDLPLLELSGENVWESVCPTCDLDAQTSSAPTSPSHLDTGGEEKRCCRSPRSSACIKLGRLTGPLIIFSATAIIFIILGREYMNQILNWLETLPLIYSLCLFVLLFTIISFPFGFGYIILNMTSGYLYGMAKGQAVVTISVAIGFSIAFLLLRSCLREWALQYISSMPTLLALSRVLEGPQGFRVILLTRFTPVPFGLQNTLFAMTQVSFSKTFFGSILGLFPTQLLNTYMGSTVRNMKEVLSDRANGYIILIVQIIFSVLLSLYLVNKAKKELSKFARPLDVESGLVDDKH